MKKNKIPLYEQILNSPPLLGFLGFLFMAILNFSCLNNPPYWDDILGLHNQAIWLAKNNFNIIELWKPEHGDANVYKFGIIPYFYGILYSLFSPQTVHVIGHLFNISCLALVFGLSYSILCKFGVLSWWALLWCIAAMCEPVMAGRVTALGQECTVLCATILCIYFLADKKYWLGFLFIVIAVLCKTTAINLAAAFILWLFADICLSGNEWRQRLKKYCPFFIGAILLIGLSMFERFGVHDGLLSGKIIPGQWLDSLDFHFRYLMPVQFAALLIMVFVTVVKAIAVIKNKTLFKLPDKDKISLLILIMTGGFWVSYSIYNCPLPRYTAFIVFPMYIFIALNTFSQKKYLTSILAVFLMLIGILNTNGSFYLKLPNRFRRSGEYLERSREYLNDLWENQKACKLLETRYFNRPVVAKWPFLQMLSMPEMGYVSKALPNVYAACPPISYAKIKIYDPKVKMPDNTIYVFGFNSLEAWTKFGPSLMPDLKKRYKIILKNQIRDGWLVLYEKEPERSAK